MQNRFLLPVFSMAILFSLQSVSFADPESYKEYPAGGGCFYRYNLSTSVWDIDCGSLPEIMVTADRPSDEHIDHELPTPWFHEDLWRKVHWWDDGSSRWEEVPASTMPLTVYFELKPGQSNVIDCAPPGTNGEQRKRYLIVRTEPVLEDLHITDIIKTRLSAAYGHNHSADQDEPKCRGATVNDFGYTDENGIHEFYYRGPEAAGETRVTIEWLDPRTSEEQTPRTGSAHLDFINRHDGLVEITGGTGMTLTGQDSYHQAGDIHWATSTTKSRIGQLASHYYSTHSENLVVNDASLLYGGLYDFQENWDTPHAAHREGKNCDIYPTVPDSSKWAIIKSKITDMGSSYLDEINTSSPHIHFIE